MVVEGPSRVFDPCDPAIKNDLHLLIHQYLSEQQLFSAANAVQADLSQKSIDALTKRSQVLLLKNLLCRGEWDEAHQLLAKLVPRLDIRRFLYHFNRLEYLELIETSQHQHALVFLQTHLKPFEDIAVSQSKDEFKELCYLLSCRTLADSDAYRPFAHFMRQREIAAEEICDSLSKYLQVSLDIASGDRERTRELLGNDKDGDKDTAELPTGGRLVSLLQQAFAYQILLRAPPSAVTAGLVVDSLSATDSTAPAQIPDVSSSLRIPSVEKGVAVHRLIEDYKPSVVPSQLMSLLTMRPSQGQEDSSSHHSMGDLKCVAMTTAASEGGVLGAEEKLTVVAGTDRGSVLLWQVPVSRGVVDEGLQHCSSDVSLESFKSRVAPPSAVLQLRKGDNVRVRRTYREDDDDNSELFPPKIRDVAVSSTTGSLAWSHSDSSVSSSVLVAAGLSDGTIALVCAGYQAMEEEDYLSSSLYSSSTGRRGLSQSLRQKSRSRSRSRGRGLPGDDSDQADGTRSRSMAFSQRRSYLETHEGDVYSVAFHPEGRHLTSGGSDRTVAVHDVVAATCIKQFEGHNAAVSHVTYNRLGNLVISSSRDGTVKFWDTLSGLCVKTIVPTLLVGKNSAHVSNNNGPGYKGEPLALQDKQSASLFVSSSASSPSVDYTGGEIFSTAISDDGRYLLAAPKLSAVRLLDLRMGSVLSLFPDSGSSSSSGQRDSGRGSLYRDREDAARGIYLVPSLPLPRLQRSPVNLSRRASGVSFRRASFCCGGSAVAAGGGTEGEVSSVRLWSAETGQLMRTLSICCGKDRSSSREESDDNSANRQVVGGNSVDRSSIEEGSEEEDDERRIHKERFFSRASSNVDYRDSQLEAIASSPVFSTVCNAQYGVVAAASASGIALWV